MPNITYMDLKPSVVDFFDFYAIYDLYLRVGGFREEGYQGYDVFVSEGVFNKIKYKYEEIVDSFYEKVYECLVNSVEGELSHFPDRCREYVLDAATRSRFYENLEKAMGCTKEEMEKRKDNSRDYPEVAYALFYYPKWQSAYGGKKWAEAAKLLVESKSIKTRHQKVFWCDRVLDLYHNTGHLLNKTCFAALSTMCVPKKPGSQYVIKPLTFRASAKSIWNFVPYVSPPVRNLIIPRKRLLDNSK